MRYFTSDLHLSHANVIAFCDRPFDDVDHMNTEIIRNINETVPLGDELWILGDVAMGNLDYSLPLVKRIVADVVIVAGNHDRCHPYTGLEKSIRWQEQYLRRTNAIRLETGNLKLTLSDGTEVNVSHFPYPTNDARPVIGRNGKVINDKFAAWRPADDQGWLLCGHVHEKWAQYDRQINVGVDAWGGYPISEEAIVAMIAEGPMKREIVKWVK